MVETIEMSVGYYTEQKDWPDNCDCVERYCWVYNCDCVKRYCWMENCDYVERYGCVEQHGFDAAILFEPFVMKLEHADLWRALEM